MLRLGMRDPLLSCVPVRQGELAVKLPGEWLRQLRQCTLGARGKRERLLPVCSKRTQHRGGRKVFHSPPASRWRSAGYPATGKWPLSRPACAVK